ncbi:MAG: NERD domain-containing protein [Clostridia bacterium]|nr:NERD domain-containing protein [Clostridia bacterium]
MWYPAFLMAAVILYYLATLPVIKGYIGEVIVRIYLKTLNPKKYRVLNNVYFPAYSGLYMQIDHMVICKGCVIIIETKNYNGIIEGDWRSKNWTIRRKNSTLSVYNPMRQNSYHVRMLLENKIVPDSTRVYSVVCLGVFAKPDTNGKMPVVTPQKLLCCIKRIVGENGESADSGSLTSGIEKLIIRGRSIGREHIKRLRSRKRRIREGFCPRCGGRLYYRNSLRGRIAICTNYPWCKFRNKTQS